MILIIKIEGFGGDTCNTANDFSAPGLMAMALHFPPRLLETDGG